MPMPMPMPKKENYLRIFWKVKRQKLFCYLFLFLFLLVALVLNRDLPVDLGCGRIVGCFNFFFFFVSFVHSRREFHFLIASLLVVNDGWQKQIQTVSNYTLTLDHWFEPLRYVQASCLLAIMLSHSVSCCTTADVFVCRHCSAPSVVRLACQTRHSQVINCFYTHAPADVFSLFGGAQPQFSPSVVGATDSTTLFLQGWCQWSVTFGADKRRSISQC